MVSASFDKPRQSIIAQVVGWITLLFGAAGLFAALQDALNTVWHAEPPKKGLLSMLGDRVASIGMLLAIGFLLLVTTVLTRYFRVQYELSSYSAKSRCRR